MGKVGSATGTFSQDTAELEAASATLQISFIDDRPKESFMAGF